MKYYHGSNAKPFDRFDVTKCGTGIVGSRYRGIFFLTSSEVNAEYYADDGGHVSLWEVCPENMRTYKDTLPVTVLSEGWPWDENDIPDALLFKDVLDGDTYSDILVINDPTIATLLSARSIERE